MVSLDLQDAYLQVPVYPASRHYLRFCVGDAVYQFRALCFSLSSAPQVFTRIMAPISSIMHHHGFRLLHYLDDWLVLGSTFQDLMRARDFLLWLCHLLGVIVNTSKSSLVPTQTLDYLGMTLEISPLRVFPTLKRVQKFSLLLQDFLSDRLHPLSVWRSLLGMMSSMSAIVPGSRLRMRSLQLRLNSAGSLLLDGDLVSWDDGCLRDLRWWSDASHLLVGLPMGEDHPDLFLFSDASDHGWGAALGDLHLSGLWSPLCSRFSINQRELLAILYAVQGFLPHLRGRSVAVYSDNSTVLAYLRKQGGTRSSSLNAVAQELLRLCESQSVHLFPQFIPGHLNVLADSLSRRSQVLGSKWTLCPQAVSELLRRWPATIDLFATSLNHRLPVYFSPMYDPMSAGTDAMLQSWDGLQAYAFPPFSILPQVLAKVRVSRGLELTLVAPFWPQHHWVSRPSGTASGDPPLHATKEGSSQTTPFPSLPPEPVRASADCLSYLRRSARQAGFSDAVAGQLTHCRHHSTRVNYQAKWVVYHSWCHRHGHSVSRPTVVKVTDFLLYLRRSLSLSYSSIASYRSMLSGVFQFILPELSSHFVFHDLQRSFRLERPLSSSRVPPWDLLVVLQFLCGSSFEPLVSASLRSLTQKVLFLVSLATARRVGELQAVFREVSFSGSNAYVSYLPEFRVKTESVVNLLPRSFCVRSLDGFVGDLPEELLLCLVHALRSYLARTSSLVSRTRNLFVSPRSPRFPP